MDKAISTLMRTPIATTGAGRTDSGVHASQLTVHFETELPIPKVFLHSLNGLLPYDIAVSALLHPTREDLHARFDAIYRSYVYRIVQQKSPIEHEFACWVRQSLDIPLMNEAAAILLEYEDFASFCKAHANNKTTLCRMDHAYWEYTGGLLTFHVQANRFLRGMVRALVGTLLLVGSHKISAAEFRTIIEAKDRTQAGPSAAAKGLFLQSVAYPPGSFRG